MKKEVMLVIILVTLVCTIMSGVWASTWVGTTGSWDVTTNWSPEAIPGAGDETFVNNGGTVQISDGIAAAPAGLYLGHAGNGYATMTGGTLYTGGLFVGRYSAIGTMTQSGGDIVPADFRVAADEGSIGTYNMDGGQLRVYGGNFIVGSVGTGELIQTGGDVVNYFNNFYIGHVGTGTYWFKGGQIIGEGLTGGNPNPGVTFIIGTLDTARGTFRGKGIVNVEGALRNNGRVIAESYDGTDQTLDITKFSTITNAYENTIDRGWYAKDHGKLVLPDIAISAGSAAFNWGEDAADTSIDLVNSARISLTGIAADGTISGALLASDRSDLGTQPADIPIGIWDFSSTAAFASCDVTLRYDDASVVNPASLKIMQLQGSTWVNVTSSVNTTSKQITANGLTALGRFIVTADAVALMNPAINNGSLEGGVQNDYWGNHPAGWTYTGAAPFQYYSDPGHVQNGLYSTFVPGSELGATSIINLLPSYTIAAGSSYEMSFYALNPNGYGEQYMYPVLKAVDGFGTKTKLGTFTYGTTYEAGPTWQQITFNTGIVPNEVIGQKLEVSLWSGYGAGTFDNIVVTATRTEVPTGFSLTGTVNLFDFGGDKTTIPVVVNLSGTDYPLNLDADGKFTILNVAAGTYDVRIKASHWLAKMTSGVVVSANTDMGIVSVINGDVVDNNEVDFSDINATRSAYGSFPGDETWNERADVDGSLEVDFTDINIVRANYGEIGD